MTNKPKEQNHEMYCEKDFCKYGEPDCPVVLRGIKDIKPRELDNAITNNWAYDFGSIERYFDDNK